MLLIRSRTRARRHEVDVLRGHIARLQEELCRSRTDPVTTLPTREHWTRVAEARFPYVAAVLLVDVNDFKQINDTHGHAAGDHALAAVAAALRESLGRSGLIGRLGGDEFAAVITAARAGFDEVLDRVEEIAEAGVHVDFISPFSVSLSIGIAGIADLPELSLPYALAAADLAMYAAKRHYTRRFHPAGEAVLYHRPSHGTPVLTEHPTCRTRYRDRNLPRSRPGPSPMDARDAAPAHRPHRAFRSEETRHDCDEHE